MMRNKSLSLPVVDVGLEGPCDIVRERLSNPLDDSAGDAVHLAAPDDLGVGEAQRG